MKLLTQETICLITFMVLATTVTLVVGHDVRRMKTEIHQARAEACYQRYEINRNTGETFLAEDYCP